KTSPKRGFSDGNFMVEFKEENPQELMLHYGNMESGMQEKNLNLNNCSMIRGKTTCDTNVNLNEYNGEQIEYWFSLADIANGSAESRHLNLEVDTEDPVIIDINYTINERVVNFNIVIDEDNFDGAEYFDENDRSPMWKPLCSRLRDNICSARKTFSLGEHDLSIQVFDKAGNSVAEDISFII
ncbi:MAG: hypothetical protein AABY22_26945, partial [Nanoarchaeota archaeon]